MLLNIQRLMDDVKCYEVVRELQWAEGWSAPAVAQRRSISEAFTTTKCIASGMSAKGVVDSSTI